MSEPTYSENARAPKPPVDSSEKESLYARGIDRFDAMHAGKISINIGGLSAYELETTGEVPESLYRFITFTGTLTANCTVSIPVDTDDPHHREYVFTNSTSGGFAVVVDTTDAGSSGVTLVNGLTRHVWHDDVDTYFNVVPQAPLVLFSEAYAATGNVGTGETDLFSFPIPAGLLANDHESISFEVFGELANNANNKKLKVTLDDGSGAAAVGFDSGNVTHAAKDWRLQCTIMRTASATQHVATVLSYNGQSSIVDWAFTNEAHSSVITLKVTGTGGASNDILIRQIRGLWYPAT